MKRVGKRGSSHFEIIISFILFVGFTLFLVLSLEPTKKDLLEESILFGLKNSFFEQTTINLTSVLIDLRKDNQGQGSNCNENQDTVCFPSELSNDGQNLIYVKEQDCIYRLFYSEEFEGRSISSGCQTAGNSENDKYKLGYVDKQELLSNKTIFEMKKSYSENYDSLKEKLGVPFIVDFAIDASDNSLDMDRDIPTDAEVIAGTYRGKVLYSTGSVINVEFILKVW